MRTKILAIKIMLLGVIHIIVTFTPIVQGGLDVLPERKFSAMIYMSLMCGLLLVVNGALIFYLTDKVKEYRFLYKPYSITAYSTILSGILSVVFMPHNVAAWILVAVTVMFGYNHYKQFYK